MMCEIRATTAVLGEHHVGTGYTLVRWMIETGHWPEEKPLVHSANPVGRKRMQEDIDRWFGQAGQGEV